MSRTAPRSCPVCLGEKKQLLFHQDFSSYSEGGLMEGYNVVVCARCGAAYSDDIPPQERFDTYYADMSKYEDSATGGKLSAVNTARFREVFELVAPGLRSDAAIADVGCATGGLLAEFKRRGFKQVMGFDPSPVCSEAAKRLYEIEVRTLPIRALTDVSERFDVVLLTGVLEHLRDVDISLAALLGLLDHGGRIYVEVPDATRYDHWFSAPFQFFSMEHVNFFSPTSLSNLFFRHGLRPVFVKQVDRFLSATAVEPAMAALFELDDSAEERPLRRDEETKPALLRYVDQSRAQDKRISSIIGELVRKQVPLAVWGTGTHTLRLLKKGLLAQANIVAFVDSNPRYQGKTLLGLPIVSPTNFDPRDAGILISSHVAEAEIKAQIQDSLRWPNEVICLYPNTQIDLPVGPNIPA